MAEEKKKNKITSVSDKITIVEYGYKIKIKTKTYFDYLYKDVYYWMGHHGYKWKELMYGVIEHPSGGKRIEIVWQGTKQVDDYVTYIINCHLAADGTDVNVKLDNGKETKLFTGTHEFRIGASIKKNTDFFEGKLLGDQQAKLYEMLIRDRLDNQSLEAYTEVHKLINHLKSVLQYYPELEK